MSIIVPGFSSSQAVPGVYLAVILGGAGTSSGVAPRKIILMGNKVTTNLTATATYTVGAPVVVTTTAGTLANATPTFVASADDAATLAGAGSEIHVMARAVFAQYPDATCYVVTSAESAGARASLVLTFATTAAAAFTVQILTAGQTYNIPVAVGDVVQDIGAAVADTINDDPNLNFTATNALGVVTFTAKHPGPRGNSLLLRALFVDAASASTRITAASTTSPGATTGILSGGAAEGAEYRFSGGTTDDDNTAALASMASTRYDRIVGAYIDSTNIGNIVTHMNALATAVEQKWQQAIVPSTATDTATTALAQAQNASRLQLVWHYNNPCPPCVTAAEVAAARLIGDARAGGILPGEASDPAANLDFMKLVTTPPQYGVADQPTGTELNNALNTGVTPIAPDPDRASGTIITRSITTRSLAGGTPNYAVRDTTNVTVPDYTADYLRADLATTFAGVKLGSDRADGLPPPAPNVVTPSMIRARIAFNLAELEAQGILRDVEANLPLLVVREDPQVLGRVNANIPCEPAPGLHQIGGNVRQTT